MTRRRHSWRIDHRDNNCTPRICMVCGLLCYSRHEWNGRHAVHWKEYYHPESANERLMIMPECESTT